MPQLIASPTTIPVPGGKKIDEYVGRVNSGTATVSVAQMTAPGGWNEPAQTPEFDEVTLVLRGTVRVEHDGGVLDVRAGEAVLTRAGERVRYSTPDPDGRRLRRDLRPRVQPGSRRSGGIAPSSSASGTSSAAASRSSRTTSTPCVPFSISDTKLRDIPAATARSSCVISRVNRMIRTRRPNARSHASVSNTPPELTDSTLLTCDPP